MTKYYDILQITGPTWTVFDTITDVANYLHVPVNNVLKEIGFNNFRELAIYKANNSVKHFNIEHFVTRRLNVFLSRENISLRIARRRAMKNEFGSY